MKVIICDDEALYREEILDCLKKYEETYEEAFEIEVYDNGEECLQVTDADILLLDVEMPGIGGVNIKDLFQERKLNTKILFITSHDEVFREAYGKNVYGFLEKPLNCEIFFQKMNQMRKEIREENQSVLIDTFEGLQKIYIKDILYIKAERKYCRIYLLLNEKEETVMADVGIHVLTGQLTPYGLFLCHKSYLVNLLYVSRIAEKTVTVHREEIPLSRRNAKQIKTKLAEFIGQRMM